MKTLNVLFVYFIHGLNGQNKDFMNIKIKLEETFEKLFNDDENNRDVKNKIFSYCTNSNSGMGSTFPLEVMFENDFKEYTHYFENTLVKSVKRAVESIGSDVECNIYISLSGHSLGGNVARGTITKLYSPYSKENSGETFENFFEYIKKEYPFIKDVKPCSYLSLSSPHLGSLIAESNETSKLMKKAEKKLVKTFCNNVIGDVGKELTFQDEKVGKKSNMENSNKSQANKISKYAVINCCDKASMDALARFPNRTLTAFLRYDLQVKYCSAMGCIETPMPTVLDNNKEILIDDGVNDTRIVMLSGFNEDEVLEYYQKEVFNENVSKNFYYNNTKIVSSPDIDNQINRALLRKKIRMENKKEHSSKNEDKNDKAVATDDFSFNDYQENANNIKKNYETMEDEFVIDNINETEIPVALIKLFNQISFRRVSMDFVVPYGVLRMLTHGLCLDVDFILARRACIRNMAEKTKSFYTHLLIADFIRTSEQRDTYSLTSLFI